MKKLGLVLIVLALSLMIAVPAFAVTSDDGWGNPIKLTGQHFNLNIIGVNNKSADMTGNGNVIFMPLSGTAKILLTEGDDYAVLDKNGTDSNGAAFQLPNPDPENDGVTEYSVFARALGKPGGSSEMTSGAYYIDPVTGELLEKLSVISLKSNRDTGKATFTNVSKELLYVYVDLAGDGTAERYNLFNDAMQDYFWNYDNKGLRLLQLRFYPISTTVPVSFPVQ